MIMLPTMQIWKLNMSIWQKAEAMSMFAVGILSVGPLPVAYEITCGNGLPSRALKGID